MTREEAIEIANDVELCQTIWIDDPGCEAVESVVRFAQRVLDTKMPEGIDAEWVARRTQYDVKRERMKAYPLFEALEQINMLSVSQFRNHADMALECQDIAGRALDKHVRERVALPEQEPPSSIREKLADSLADFHKWTDLIRSGEAEVTGITIMRVPPNRHPMPVEHINKHFGPWNSLEEIVRWVESYHGVEGGL